MKRPEPWIGEHPSLHKPKEKDDTVPPTTKPTFHNEAAQNMVEQWHDDWKGYYEAITTGTGLSLSDAIAWRASLFLMQLVQCEGAKWEEKHRDG